MYLDGELQASYRRFGAGTSAESQEKRTALLRLALSRPGSPFPSKVLDGAVAKAKKERASFADALKNSR